MVVKSVSDFVTAMEKFTNNFELVEQMCQHSRMLAVKKFDVKKMNKDLMYHMGLN